MIRAIVASTAVGLVPTTTRPICLGLPMIGPSPSMQMMPSTMAMVLGSEALMSKTVCGNAGVVQHVLRPAVFDAGNHAVQVFQRGGEADPVVRLQLGHRDDQIGLDHRARKIKARRACWPGRRCDPGDFFVIQIGELQRAAVELFLHARLDQGHLGVAHVAGPFADDDLGSPAAKDFGRGDDHRRMGRHVRHFAVRLDQVRLEQHALARPSPGFKPAASSPSPIVRSSGPS